MENVVKEPYKGCRDFFPEQKRKLDFIFSKMRQAAEAFGYEPYDGPLLESIELYLAKSGEELINDQIYKFVDRGNRTVAIRPEMTPTLARMVAQVHREVPKPIRWYAIPNLMRYEKPQRGRLREHWQFNCDVFGAPEGKGEVEIILLIIHFLKSFGATSEHAEVLINDRRIVDSFFNEYLKVESNTKKELLKILDRSKKISRDNLVQQINDLIPDQEKQKNFLEYLSLTSFEDLKLLLGKANIGDCAKELFAVLDQLNHCGVKNFINFDPSIVRGLDYYTGIVFEVFDKNPENRRAICGGGAYANLLQIFKEPSLPGVGFGMGDVTLMDFLTTHNLIAKDIYPSITLLISHQSAEAENIVWKIAQELRARGVSVEMILGEQKMKKIMQHAEHKKHKYSLIIGEKELAEKNVSIKNLNTKESVSFPLDNSLVDSLVKFL